MAYAGPEIFCFALLNLLILSGVASGRVVQSLQAHDEAVACLATTASAPLVISGSWSSDVKVGVLIISIIEPYNDTRDY